MPKTSLTPLEVRIRVAEYLRQYRSELFALATDNWEELLTKQIRRPDGKVSPFECIADILKEQKLYDGNLVTVGDVVLGLRLPSAPETMSLAAGHLNGSGITSCEAVAAKVENFRNIH